MPRPGEKVPHLIIRGFSESIDFQPVSGSRGGQRQYPKRDYRKHGARLVAQLDELEAQVHSLQEERLRAQLQETAGGVTATFELLLNPELRVELNRLEDRRAGIQLLNVQELEDDKGKATVFIPYGQLAVFERKLEAYLDDEKVTKKGLRKNELLVNSIEQIRKAVLDDFWTDEWPRPADPKESFWSEIWVRNSEDFAHEEEDRTIDLFRSACQKLGIRLGTHHLRFPDRTVLLAHTTLNDLTRSAELLDSIAEIRRPATLALELMELRDRSAERDRVGNLAQRLRGPAPEAPAVCILDTGVDHGHPLLSPAIEPADSQTYNPAWASRDVHGHGTEMAGFAVYGAGLDSHLLSDQEIPLENRLESVKILPDDGAHEPQLYGEITGACVALAEVQNPARKRAISMAVTAYGKTRGMDTSWSAAIDQLCSGQKDEPQRLFLVAAGNCNYLDTGYVYPDSNQTAEIRDPGQAWNAVTVGSSTEIRLILEPDLRDWSPVAPPGDFSPSSRHFVDVVVGPAAEARSGSRRGQLG